MPAPVNIFIDTGILDRECYDFASSHIKALLEAVEDQNKKLLLPQPTALEIENHIHEKTRQAVVSLMKARQEHAMLRGNTGIPQSRLERDHMIDELRVQVLRQWASFKTNFDCVALDYSGVSVAEVMDWYTQVQPPFGPGKKQKEFPDAFSLAALLAYAVQNNQSVAVVSTDNDFKRFCDTNTQLRFYPDLDTLTSELVADADAHKQQQRFTKAVDFAHAAIPALIARIKADFPDRAFWHELAPADENEDIDNIIATDCELTSDDLQVVGIDPQSFSISFRGEVTFTADVAYADPDSWINMGDGEIMYGHRCAGNVTETAVIHGSAHFNIDSEWSEEPEISDLTIEEDSIWMQAPAPQVDDHDYGDQQG